MPFLNQNLPDGAHLYARFTENIYIIYRQMERQIERKRERTWL